MKKFLKASVLVSVMVLLAFTVVGCGGQDAEKESGAKEQASEPVDISIATGGTSGTYYPLGSAVATVVNEAKLDINATAESTGGSVENARLILQNAADFGFIESGIAKWAYNGEEMFEGNPVENIRGVIALYPNTMQTVVKVNSGIESYADLKGKRVAIGVQGGSTPLNMEFTLDQYGISLDDIKPEYLGYGEAMQLLKDNQLDAVLVDSGAPSSSIIDISTQHEVRILPIEADVVSKMKESYPFFADSYVIPAGTYKGIDQDIPTTGSKVMIAVSADVPDEVVYNVVKTMFESKEKIVNVHEAGKSIQLETALDTIAIPLHPGAEKYYKEQGLIE
ncbi:TAXI family TRAP transporter solute-binding subunit [Metallumcola ferriviriculae]|uniref:TAXI family TRAP transporter solute-binding subunit n=1 Tax=Metallumcola ferriviriculae TaxID=3039180 RepID=A0AAU0URA6_9FIRM|nr:TAXI family TRAP transporter solute-binding subunit [Desulfitibacteraceae bacterium MK1]